MNCSIREFRAGDAPALAALFHAAVHALAARDYTLGQLAAWSPAPPDPRHYLRTASDGRRLLVAAGADDRPLAYADLEPDGHIDHFYCHPDAAGTGVAVALYEALERCAAARGLPGLHTEASAPARRFFERRGFAVEHRCDFEIGGVAIHNYRMTKRLIA